MPSLNNLSDVYRGSHPLNFPHKILDLSSVTELPETHAWTTSHEPSSDDPIPVIDLNDKNAIEFIGHACKKWGVFQIINHNISKTLLQEIEFEGKKLFSLPMKQKLNAARSPDGVSGYGVARISSFFPKLMWSEGFTIVDSPLENAIQLWPQDYRKFCEMIEEYQKVMKKLARRIMWLMLGSMGITKEDVTWADPINGGCAALQLNSYPACPDPDRAMGLAAHTDSTILTILHQSNVSGLQVLPEGSNGWITVPPHPGALVIHVGDLMHILSNGLYPSVLHRAMVNRTQHRLSVAYLYGPPKGVKIGPLSKLVDHLHPPLYRPITWSEYLGTKAEHFDKALKYVRICDPRAGFLDNKDNNSTVRVLG